jgi:hypothetical protein
MKATTEMAKRRKADNPDKGRNYYETSSPFETQVQQHGTPPKTYAGITDEQIPLTPTREMPSGRAFLRGPDVIGAMQTEQYDNPRGFPGISMVTAGEQKSKLGKHDAEHSIQHKMEGAGKLARTGK